MRSATITSALVAAAASLLLAAGCSSTTTGSGVPASNGSNTIGNSPAPTSSSAGDGQTFGAPRVTTPMDTSKYQQNPCSALSPAQQQQFGITAPGKMSTTPLGTRCIWAVPSGGIAIVFAVRPNPDTTHTGLANVYEVNPRGSLRQLPDMDGQPAVAQPPSYGECDVFVGATDSVDYQLKLVVSPPNPAFADTCGFTQQVAVAATTTMKSGA